jgi:Lysophospholipase
MSNDSYMMFVSFIKRRLSVMKFNEGYFDSQGDIKVYYYSWVPENPKGVIQIAHGMCEKALRYSYVAEKISTKWICSLCK